MKKKYLFITNNKNIFLELDKDKGFININNLINKNLKSIIDIHKINSLKLNKIKKIKNNFFFKEFKDIYIIRWAIRKKLKDTLRGYCIVLNLIGLGFTMTIWKDNQIRFNIGYNHLIYYNIPKGVLIRSRSRRNLFLFSYSFFFLKKIVTEIKNFRRLSIYKLKGIKEKNELYNKKNWKKGLY